MCSGRSRTTPSCRNFGNSLPWEACFLLLEPHFGCQIGPCKLHPINFGFSTLRRCCYVDVKPTTYEASFFLMLFYFPTKERLAAMRGTAQDRHTYSECAPLQGTKPRDLCLKDRTFRSFSLPVLNVVESFPGAMSPLGSKEPNEPFFSPHKVFVASRPQKSAR